MRLTTTLHHAAIEVSDLDAAIAWYSEHLEFVFERRFELPEVGIEIAYLTSDALRIELLRRPFGPAPEGFRAPMHICFEVDDIEQAAEELRRRGVEFAQEPKRIEPARVKNLWIRDHEGHLIEFLETVS